MTKDYKNKFSVRIAVIVLFALIAVCSFFVAIAKGEQHGFDEVSFKPYYKLGEEIEFNDRYYNLGGEKIKSNHTVIFPDGSAFQGKKLLLDRAGNYEVTYQANTSEGIKVDKISFVTMSGIATVKGEDDKFKPYYGNCGIDQRNGIIAEVKMGQELFFNQAVDLSGLSKTDGIISFFNIPNNVGSRDADIKVTFTDAENPEVFLSFLCSYYNEETEYATFVRAGFKDSDFVGLRYHDGQYHDDRTILYDASYYQLDKTLGTTPYYSLVGVPSTNPSIENETN